jgi:hypothetical protein
VELKDFVAESLRQILEGVTAAQGFAGTLNAFVNPSDNALSGEKTYAASILIPGSGPYRRVVQMIEFDVALVVSTDTLTKAGAGVLAVVSVGGSKATAAAQQTTSRLKFSIPIVLPFQPGTEFKSGITRPKPPGLPDLPPSPVPAPP